MPSISNIGSIGTGTCPAHDSPVSYTTVIVTGAPITFSNGVQTGYVGSIGTSTCGHPTVALTGFPTVFAEGSQVHRVGDIGSNPGTYVLVTGYPQIQVG